ncbi:hypothetical protein GEMRC1_000826 [Eukaryota sp. GEM-RC1]
MSILSSLFPKFLQSAPIGSLPELVCSPKAFCQLSSNVLSSHVLWFASTLVSSYKDSNWNVDEFENCFYSLDFSSTPINQLVQELAPLKSETELKRFLLEFNSLVIVPKLIQISEEQRVENLNLKANISDLRDSHQTDMTNLNREIRKLKKKEVPRNSNGFSPINKHYELQVSVSKKRVVFGSGSSGRRNILGENPLFPGNVYSWRLKYQGGTRGLFVGVIDESKFSVDSWSEPNGIFNGDGEFRGCLSGNKTQWNPGELLEINVNLINYTLTIMSVSNFSINITGTLPRLSSGNYYPFASLFYSDHVLEIID